MGLPIKKPINPAITATPIRVPTDDEFSSDIILSFLSYRLVAPLHLPLTAVIAREPLGVTTLGKSVFLWIWKEEGTPAERARGVAVGIFSGCFPFFGLQSLMGVCLASLVRGHHLLAVIGTWISNPLTYLPLYWLNYRVGSFVLGRGHIVHIDAGDKDEDK